MLCLVIMPVLLIVSLFRKTRKMQVNANIISKYERNLKEVCGLMLGKKHREKSVVVKQLDYICYIAAHKFVYKDNYIGVMTKLKLWLGERGVS